MIPSIEVSGDSEMKQQTSNAHDETDSIDLEHYRRLVRTHIDMVSRYRSCEIWRFSFYQIIIFTFFFF